MEVKSIELSNKILQITLSGVNSVSAVYIDKAANYNNSYSLQPGNHTYTAQYVYSNNILKITLPKISLTFFTITIASGNETLVTMYLNLYSLFKAKSKYFQAFEGCNCNSNHNLMCTGCGEKTKRYKVLTYMLKLNLFQQAYVNGDINKAVFYYKEACRIYDMDTIYFENVQYNSAYNSISGNLELLFITLNNWIKGNACACELKVLESLLIADLYSLIFGGLDLPTGGEDESETPIETSQMYYGYLEREDVADWNSMKNDTHKFDKLTVTDISNGISSGTITKTTLKSGTFTFDVPVVMSCIVVLIPQSSTKVCKMWNGITEESADNAWVSFTMSGEYFGVGIESNGEQFITIDDVVYKIYGCDSSLINETKIKIS